MVFGEDSMSSDDRFVMLGNMILQLSMSQQPCDITFYDRPAKLDVKIDPNFHVPLMYGAGAQKLMEMLEEIRLSDGSSVSINEVWTIHPMPHNGISDAELAAVDLKDGDALAGPLNKTVREMIREVYHCQSDEDAEKYLRRYLAS